MTIRSLSSRKKTIWAPLLSLFLTPIACTSPPKGNVVATWCHSDVEGETVLDDLEDGDSKLCNPMSTWSITISDPAEVTVYEPSSLTNVKPTDIDVDPGAGADAAVGSMVSLNTSTRALKLTASFTDPANNAGWIALQAPPGVDLSQYHKLRYRVLMSPLGYLMDINLVCDACLSTRWDPSMSSEQEVWNDREVDLAPGIDQAKATDPQAALAGVTAIRFRIDNSVNHVVHDTMFTVWLDDIRLVK